MSKYVIPQKCFRSRMCATYQVRGCVSAWRPFSTKRRTNLRQTNWYKEQINNIRRACLIHLVWCSRNDFFSKCNLLIGCLCRQWHHVSPSPSLISFIIPFCFNISKVPRQFLVNCQQRMEVALIPVCDSACAMDYQMFTEKWAKLCFVIQLAWVIKAYDWITSFQPKEEEGSCFS